MARVDDVPTSAIIHAPDWLGGNSPTGFWTQGDLRGRKIDKKRGLWRVPTEENWLRRVPSLITVDDVAGPGRTRSRFEILKKMAAAEMPITGDNDKVIAREVNKAALRAAKTRSPVDGLSLAQLRTVAAKPSDVCAVVKNSYENLLEIGMESDPSDKVFANAGVHVVRRSPHLIYRLKMPSAWLQLGQDPKVSLEEPERISAVRSSGRSIFASSEGLYDGVVAFDAYVGPLVGALTPFVWAFPAARMLGVIIYSLGEPLAGTQGNASELLQILHTQGGGESVGIRELTANASTRAIAWWVNRLNEMFAVLSDPAVFTDATGIYAPPKHLHALLSIEQLFRRVFSSQTSHRDTNARRTLLFTILDTLERLTQRDLTRHCSLKFAEKTLSGLESKMPAEAAEILLPGAERGVRALEQLQEGFFIRRRKKTVMIEWTEPGGTVKRLDADAASAQYIKVLRDATHGHGSKRSKDAARTNSLLTHHDGHIPHDLGLLGYLYLLDLLSRPSDLRAALYASGRV